MSDPRNVAHDKKVKQEKEHEKEAEGKAQPNEKEAAAPAADATEPDQATVEHEKSVAVLSKLKEMEFHSRANIETLAELTLTIDDELKQKDFSDPVAALYGAQDQFQTKVTELIESYEAHVGSMKPTA
ncbi:MAG: hypothetical protein ACR2G0_09145 [Chthoniobacterales bacterium]